MRMKTVVACAAVLALSSVSFADYIISSANVVTGVHSQVVNGNATITANGGEEVIPVIGTKTVAGYKAFGVQGGNAGGEIAPGEYIDVVFNQQFCITDLTLSFLYATPHNGDRVNEIAVVYADGITEVHTLTVNAGGATALWSRPGSSVATLSPGTYPNGGTFSISNPFSQKVTTLSFLTVDNPAVTGAADSDFGIYQIAYRVPEPGSIGLMLSGLLAMSGFYFSRGRRSRK